MYRQRFKKPAQAVMAWENAAIHCVGILLVQSIESFHFQ